MILNKSNINFEPNLELLEIIRDWMGELRRRLYQIGISCDDKDLYAIKYERHIFVFANPVLLTYTYIDEDGNEVVEERPNIYMEIMENRPISSNVFDDNGRFDWNKNYNDTPTLKFSLPRVVIRIPMAIVKLDLEGNLLVDGADSLKGVRDVFDVGLAEHHKKTIQFIDRGLRKHIESLAVLTNL